MPRRKAALKREILPDPLFSSEEVTKFINVIIRQGKKSIAEKIVYQSLFKLHERMQKEGKSDETGDTKSSKPAAGDAVNYKDTEYSREEVLSLLRKSLTNIAPAVEVKSRRVGGATYQVPIEVPAARGLALAMRWVVNAAKSRSEKTMSLRLSAELYEACMGRGSAVKKRDDVHRMAKANQAFAHYRW